MQTSSVLVVEDEDSMRLLFTSILKKEGYLVDGAANVDEALIKLRTGRYQLVLTDLRMPGRSGLDLLYAIRENWEEIPVIILTAYGTIETAVEAMKQGAVDFITKPLANPEQLRIIVKRTLEKAALERENTLLRSERGGQEDSGVVFEDPKMVEIIKLVEKVAVTNATVLVTGESGTGKEVIARLIHRLSRRKDKPFVAVNCGALSETLLDSELFGHEKGAFTGAIEKKLGRFELADGATLFLDEIGEISSAMQVKLLRVLQEKNFERVGGVRPISVDVRVIAATNRNLQKAVQDQVFREDLYYRLNVFPIEIPPLRERPVDILKLADFFLRKYTKEFGKDVTGFNENAIEMLTTYSWPGNVRELSNMIERAVIISNGPVIQPEELSIYPTVQNYNNSKAGLLHQTEQQVIIQTLNDFAGNRKLTAEKLGISLRTLQYKLKEYGLV